MSIRIDKITRGRFGNKLLQYNSLLQLSKIYNVPCSFVQNNEITHFFNNIVPYIPSKKPVKLLTCKMILENEKLDFENYEYKLDDPAYCLHNVFYKLTKFDPRFFLELKDKFKVDLQSDRLNIGIHIRGGDIISRDGNNGREIHEFEYYKKAIEYVLKTFCKDRRYMFYICTDDTDFETYKQTYNYFVKEQIPLKVGPVVGNENQYITDWSILNGCDILINSSSTFCITAGYLNKKLPKIIHSEKWINKNINHTSWNNKPNTELYPGYKITDLRKTFDDFWIDTLKKHDYYYSYKLI